MTDSTPGGEKIILEGVPTAIYCGGCMVKMEKIGENKFQCPNCGTNYER